MAVFVVDTETLSDFNRRQVMGLVTRSVERRLGIPRLRFEPRGDKPARAWRKRAHAAHTADILQFFRNTPFFRFAESHIRCLVKPSWPQLNARFANSRGISDHPSRSCCAAIAVAHLLMPDSTSRHHHSRSVPDGTSIQLQYLH